MKDDGDINEMMNEEVGIGHVCIYVYIWMRNGGIMCMNREK